MVIGIREVRQSSSGPPPFGTGAERSVAAVTQVPFRSRLDLFGVLIDRVDQHAALERVRRFLAADAAHQIVTVNLDFLYLAERDVAFREMINEADLAVPDGMPLIWLSRLMGTPLAGRVTGVDLVSASCRLAEQEGIGVFLLGGSPTVAAAAAERLRVRHPSLTVTAYAPPFGPIAPDEDERIVQMILDARPGFLFVALGAPRQDLWIRDHRERLGVPVAMGVGCVLDLLAGAVDRAPEWMQAAGFEWSYRLSREPRRLWRRYLLNDLPLFGRLSLMALDVHRAVGNTPYPYELRYQHGYRIGRQDGGFK